MIGILAESLDDALRSLGHAVESTSGERQEPGIEGRWFAVELERDVDDDHAAPSVLAPTIATRTSEVK